MIRKLSVIKTVVMMALFTLLGTPLSHANQGCALVLHFNTKITAQYGITAIFMPQSGGPGLTVYPGQDPGGISFSTGDQILVYVDSSKYVCGSLSSIGWGYTQWIHCNVTDGQVQIKLGGNWYQDIYQAQLSCQCPQAGSGALVDEHVGVQCSPQPQP